MDMNILLVYTKILTTFIKHVNNSFKIFQDVKQIFCWFTHKNQLKVLIMNRKYILKIKKQKKKMKTLVHLIVMRYSSKIFQSVSFTLIFKNNFFFLFIIILSFASRYLFLALLAVSTPLSAVPYINILLFAISLTFK